MQLYFLCFSETICKKLKNGLLIRSEVEVRGAGKEMYCLFYNLSVQSEFTIYIYYFKYIRKAILKWSIFLFDYVHNKVFTKFV